MEQGRIIILIACHKPYPLPQDPCYLPMEVGAELHTRPIPRFTPDNSEDNISAKNANYCELTAVYWAWKNLNADYIGLCHYRRYFATGFSHKIAGEADYKMILTKAPMILPKPRHYWIETNYSQYIHAHHEQDLIVTRDVLEDLYPVYLEAFDRQMQRRIGHRFNMFVMRQDLFNSYCEWLFSVLFEVEQRLDITSYDAYDARVFGFIAERLLDVWIETNHVLYREMPIKSAESQHWLRKGTAFVMRKFGYHIR